MLKICLNSQVPLRINHHHHHYFLCQPHLTDDVTKFICLCLLYSFFGKLWCRSRITTYASNTERQLADYAYKAVLNKFATLNIDLFASRINTKCRTYIWHRDPNAYSMNAFTISWTNFCFYSFPQFAAILKSLSNIISDNAVGIMVAPQWPTQTVVPSI